MTLIILAVLAAAWLGYFALWFRDRRTSRARRGDGVADTSQYFDRSFDVTSRERVSFASAGNGARNLGDLLAGRDGLDAPQRAAGNGARNLGDLLESPRTRQQALRRRRRVATVLIAVALGSLLAVPAFGPAALAVHVMVDVVLILFAFAFSSVHRRQAPAVNLVDVRVLCPDRPAPSDAVAMPLRRVANG